MLYSEIIAVCSEIHTKHINTELGIFYYKIWWCIKWTLGAVRSLYPLYEMHPHKLVVSLKMRFTVDIMLKTVTNAHDEIL
jgi:hypothetical protein